MISILIILFLLLLVILSIGYIFYEKKLFIKKIKDIHSLENINIQLQNKQKEIIKLNEEEKQLQKELSDISKSLLFQKEESNALYEKEKERLKERIDNFNQLTLNAKNEYLNNLELSYIRAEKEYNEKIEMLKKEIYTVKAYLDKEKATMQANIEARLREKEIKEKLSFYCLTLSENDKADIQKLENIKLTLNKPRVLSMLIWQTWFQKPLKTLAANILGVSTVTGIYKITNIVTEECYIGQATDVASRWSEHAKCGLGIDTPANNKLYTSMKEYGLWNFSWELLEKCSREQLNEKERYYIELYHSNDFGFNSTKGNK